MTKWIIRPDKKIDQPAWLRMRLALWQDDTVEALKIENGWARRKQ